MTNDKNFPNTEPPPSLKTNDPAIADSSNTSSSPYVEQPSQVVDTKIMDALTPDAIATQASPVASNVSSQPIPNVQNQVSESLNQVPPESVKEYIPKKRNTKVMLIILCVLGLLMLIGLAAIFLRKDQTVSLVGTKGELTWWGVKNSESVVKPLIDDYVSKNPNVKITYIKQSESDYRERLVNSLAQGKGPDIFEIHNSWVPMFRTELSVIPNNVIGIDEYKNTFYPVAVQDFSTEGGIVAIPLEYDALALFYNQDIFDSAAIVPPETWDEVVSIAQGLTQKGDRGVILQSGVALGVSDNIDYWPEIIALMVIQNKADLANPDIKAWDAIAYYSSFAATFGVWNTSMPNSLSAFAKNKLGMLFAPTSATRDIILENPNLRFKTTVLPQLPKNVQTDPDYSYATYWAQSVWNRSKNSEVAWDFLKFLSSGESLQKMNNIRKTSSMLEKAYPRQEMAVLQKDDKILGSILVLAKNAKSWYLNDKTFDGQTGLNTQMNNVYKDILNSVSARKDPRKSLGSFVSNVKNILVKYAPKK